jgi:hypothetical protein
MGFSLKSVLRKVGNLVTEPTKILLTETSRVLKQVQKLPSNLVNEAKRLPGNIGKAVGSVVSGVSEGLFGKDSLKKIALIGGGCFLAYKLFDVYVNRDSELIQEEGV